MRAWILKRTICWTTLAASVAAMSTAHAQSVPQPLTVEFAFHGFADAATGAFDPGRWAKGSFIGTDVDSNSVLSMDELSHFDWDGINYSLTGLTDCGGEVVCSLRNFNYPVNGQPEFTTLWWSGAMEGATVSGVSITLSVNVGGEGSHTDLWTPQTQYVSTVPEPGEVTMLFAGLGLGVMCRAIRRPKRVDSSLRA
jgi:hypothetical protein